MLRLLLASAVVFALAVPVSAQNPEPLLKRVGAQPTQLVKAGRTDAEIVDALYFITLGRLPNEKEKEASIKFMGLAKKRDEAGRDLAWALVNTKEFLKVHSLDSDPAEALKIINKFIAEWGKEEKKEAKKEEKKEERKEDKKEAKKEK
jgi:hypothetical protein